MQELEAKIMKEVCYWLHLRLMHGQLCNKAQDQPHRGCTMDWALLNQLTLKIILLRHAHMPILSK